MSNRLVKIAAVAAGLAASPVMAHAHTVAHAASSPVEILPFNVGDQYIVQSDDGGFPARTGLFATNVDPGSILLRFVNRSAVPATSVTFVVKDGEDSRSIIDKGNFRPGVLIEHSFGGYVGSNDVSIATFGVAEVDFADGTVWHAAHIDAGDHAGSRAASADAVADRMESRRAELEHVNAEARRVAFRHLGTSL